MSKDIGREFVHSTRGVLVIVLVATLTLGAFCMMGRCMMRAAEASTAASASASVAVIAVVEERAATPEATRIPVISGLASLLAASASDGAPTSWYALSAEVCRELLAAGIL